MQDTFPSSPFCLPRTEQKPSIQHYLLVSLAPSLKKANSQYPFRYRQEERRRRSFQDYTGQKITLEAVLNTTCKKCGCKGKVKPLPVLPPCDGPSLGGGGRLFWVWLTLLFSQ